MGGLDDVFSFSFGSCLGSMLIFLGVFSYGGGHKFRAIQNLKDLFFEVCFMTRFFLDC